MRSGDKLGAYEILAPLGAGGMGEVYRARDTKLDRDVAIKVLPEAVAQNPERLARFEREAKVLAALNHPNIAQIYGVEDRALILELVEGENLSGPLPLETALDYAHQIADALEAAHEKGIVHRDLKPANVKVTPQGVVKVLDFGLAAVVQNSVAPESNATQSPTLTLGATQMGVLLGTAAYMSPEQARGKPVDKRADIWAFGVVLYEMVTGKQLFHGDDITAILAAVVLKEPDLEGVPPKIRRVLQRCLEKDVKKRLRDISGVELLLEETPETIPSATPTNSRLHPMVWGVAGILLAAIPLGAWLWRATRPVDHPLIRLSADLGADAQAGIRSTVAISPDGSRIVFPVRGTGGTAQLATRLLSQATPTVLPGTENGDDPFFSPDGQWIGFAADRKLKKISVLGGAAVTLCDAAALRGASWGEDGFIIATLNANSAAGLFRIPDAGGAPQAITKPATGSEVHRWPQILPSGKGVLFTASPGNLGFDDANLAVLSLQTGQIKAVQRGGYFGRYLPTSGSHGYLVYIHEGVLFGAPFDLDRLETRGTPAPLLEDVAADSASGGGQLDVSRTGTVVYRNGKAAGSNYPVLTLDSSGKTTPLIATPGQYFTPRFSPDGQHLALAVNAGKGMDVGVYDLQRENLTHLTFTGQRNGLVNANPVWTPDGKHIVFKSQGAHGDSLWWIRSDGGGEAQMLRENKAGSLIASSFSPDGRRLAFMEYNQETNVDIWTMPLDLPDPEHPKAGKAEKFYASPSVDVTPMFSPDGRWMAYSTNEQGRFEIFVRPFPGPGGVWQVSVNGGFDPTWSSDGKTLFFAGGVQHIYAVEYTAKGDTFTAGNPRQWSEGTYRPPGVASLVPLDLAPDGKHFAIFPSSQVVETTGSVHVTFLLNFFDEVRRRIPEK